MIWDTCHGSRYIAPLKGTLYRLIESQAQIATLGHVDTLEEQTLLEEMLSNQTVLGYTIKYFKTVVEAPQ